MRVLRDRALAEDVAQQVFWEAHRDMSQFEGRSSIRTWLFRIALHRCQDAIKSRKRRDARFELDDAPGETLPDDAPAADALVDRQRLLAALDECLAHLSPDVRATVLARFQTGMTFEELAESLDAKPDTLQTRVARALPVLRTCLERKGWAHA
jgi:RNA polymerase sigma-70 factor (ECF subfamily)